MKNIVICCDGTGNECRARKNTNIVKLFRALKKEDPRKQIAYYDPGLGTISSPGIQFPPFKLLTKILGWTFGYGFSKNLTDAYGYIMDTFEPGDRVFMFGFSRGAYTVRALTGMIKMCGLLNKGSKNLIPYAIKIYKKRKRKKPRLAKGFIQWFYYLFYFFWSKEPDWALAGTFKKTFSRQCNVHFIGVWGTVKSIGWFRRRIILPYTFFNADLQNGRHAVSIDEKRSQYQTNLWGFENSEHFKEVWFAGAHSDIGGSYEQCGLSDITLKWMLEEAQSNQLLIHKTCLEEIKPNHLANKHNPLLPMWWLLGWRKRKIIKRTRANTPSSLDPLIHYSVKSRMEEINTYGPNLPENKQFS